MANASLLMNCTAGQYIASLTKDSCHCRSGFQGTHCEVALSWPRPLQIFAWAVQEVLFVAIMYWIILKLVHICKAIEEIRATIDRVLTIVYRIDFNELAPLSVGLYTVLFAISTALIMTSANLLIGFWFDGLTKTFRPRLATRTRVAALVGCFLLILTPIGSILTSIPSLSFLGLPLFLLPLVMVVLGMMVVCIVITRLNPKYFTEMHHKLRRKTIILFFVIAVTWVIELVFVVSQLLTTSFNPSSRNIVEAITHINLILIYINSFAIMSLIDRRGGYKNLTRWAFCGLDFDSRNAEELLFEASPDSTQSTKTFDDTIEVVNSESMPEYKVTISEVTVRGATQSIVSSPERDVQPASITFPSHADSSADSS